MKKSKFNITRGEITCVKGQIYTDEIASNFEESDFEDVDAEINETKKIAEEIGDIIDNLDVNKDVTPETPVETKVKKAKK